MSEKCPIIIPGSWAGFLADFEDLATSPEEISIANYWHIYFFQ